MADPESVAGDWWLVAQQWLGFVLFISKCFFNVFGGPICKTNGFVTILVARSVKPIVFLIFFGGPMCKSNGFLKFSEARSVKPLVF